MDINKTDNTPDKVSDEVSVSTSEHVSGDASGNVTESVSNNASSNVTGNVTGNMSEGISGNVSVSTSGSVPDKASNNASDDRLNIKSGNTSEMQQVPYAPGKPKPKFQPLISDFIFAIITFFLGYLFSRWVLFTWQGWGVAVFTAAYLLTVTFYLFKKKAHINSLSAWFWGIITLATGISFALWENRGLMQLRSLLLFCSAVYYVLVASNRTIMGKTGNVLILDGINAVLIIPFRNFINQYLSFGVLLKEKKRKGRSLPILLGVLFGLILLIGLVPMLLRADSGGFGVLVGAISRFFKHLINTAGESVFYFLLGLPVAAYLYGLVSGSAHGRATDTIDPELSTNIVKVLRFFHPTTVFITLGTVCGLYLVFIFAQMPYFFSAFTGRRPEGWLIYSEYARRGFFELCGIAVINLVIITVGNLTSRKERSRSRLLKAFNIAFAVITLLIIATAMSKMILYIDAYGLTMPRLLPCVFMIFLTAVFIALIALQKWDFSIVRFALVTGSVMFCVLCLSNPDALVVRYNTDRYLNGTLVDYDIEILYRSGSAGVAPAIKVYEAASTASNEQLKDELAGYLKSQLSSNVYRYSVGRTGIVTNTYNLEMHRAYLDLVNAMG